MSLSVPLALLGLLLVPLVIALHSLAVRRKRRDVSSLVFWDEVLRQSRTSVRLRQILRNLALLAQILAVAAVVLALAGPALWRRAGAAGDAILVLDTTASMKGREGARTRFDSARDRAFEEIAGLRAGARMLVIASGRQARILCPFTADREKLRRAVREAAAGDESGSLAEGILLALSLRDAARQDRVVAITDGAFDSLAGVQPDAPWMQWIGVGSSGVNAGITSLAFRRTAGGGADYEMFLSVRNFADHALSFPLAVRAGETDVLREQLTLAPGQAHAVSIPWTGPASGRLTAQIETADDLDADDRAYAVFAPARAVRVNLVGGPDPFLENALAALPNVTVSRGEALGPDTPSRAGEPGREAVVTVYDGVPVPPLARGAFIVIGSVPQGLPLRAAGVREGLRVAGTASRHPLMQSVALDGMLVGRALGLEPGPGFAPLALAGGTPVMLAWDRAGVKLLLLGFALGDSDLPLRTAFPVLLANCLEWFFPSWLSVHAEQAAAGTVVPLESESGRQLTVLLPGGARRTFEGTGEPVDFGETSASGFYRVEGAGEPREFAVSLASAAESDIAPRFALPGGDRPQAGSAKAAGGHDARESGAGTRGSQVPLGPALALAGFLLVVLEWLAWLRESPRSVGGKA